MLYVLLVELLIEKANKKQTETEVYTLIGKRQKEAK